MTAILALRRIIAHWFGAAWQIIWRAPWLLLPIFLSEGAQHVAEIQLGMFDGRAEFNALADNATRMAFGNAKTAGLILSLLLVIRAVALGSAARAMRPDGRALVIFATLLTLTFVLDFAFQSDTARAIAPDAALRAANILLQLILLVPMLAALFEDSGAAVRKAGWSLIPAMLVAVCLAALAFAPMQWLHSANHIAALGAPLPIVWALMAFDTIWVALLTLMVGSGIATGWRTFVGAEQPGPLPNARLAHA